ncbi:MAG: helix-turn-helix domain-containing protein [Solirubrobacteraceae bacterium]
MSIGPLLRDWRTRRHLSQMDLALEAGVSTRHLSFLETGRARPSQEMLLRLAEELQVPLRERNRLLLAAGFAPRYEERSLEDPEMAPIAAAVELVLRGHDPYPALAVDHGWALVAHNDAARMLMAALPEELLAPPVNVLRASLHPDGLAPRIRNLAEWRDHLLERLRRQIALTGDPALQTLFDELAGYPVPDPGAELLARNDVVVPLRLESEVGELTFFSTVTTFGTPVDITVEELMIESFFPADEATADALRELAG